jgi:FkbM family methyltransferase
MDQADRVSRDAKTNVFHLGPGGEADMTFFTPNAVCRYRTMTFSTKEPETLAWIDEYGGRGPLYDIGANIGLYSIYYAKTHSHTVYAFEPSALNIALLAKNISINGLSDRVVLVSNPLTSKNEIADFHLSMLDEGGAMSTFGQEYGHDGQPLRAQMSYRTVGTSLDFLIESGVIPETPGMLKIDVDGIEHLVLQGARHTLQQPCLRTVLIEVNETFAASANGVSEILGEAGFHLNDQSHSEMFNGGKFSNTYNQIWIRPSA